MLNYSGAKKRKKVGNRKRKGHSGVAVKYISRTKAVRLLQLNLSGFRRLCVLKGVYPREPKSYRKIQGGDPTVRCVYLRSDVKSLYNEHAVHNLRERAHYVRKMVKYVRKRENEKLKTLIIRQPILQLEHIILERYPSFHRALQDLDDPLCSVFLTASLKGEKNHTSSDVKKCHKLTVDFMHYIIETRSLRKVFITNKGYYYRAEIQGIDVTWIVPHPFPVKPEKNVDDYILRYANEFYIKFLAFVNYKLYEDKRILYSPKIKTYWATLRKIKAVPNRSNRKLKKMIVKAKADMKNTLYSLSTPVITKSGKITDEKNEKYDLELLKLRYGSKVNAATQELEKVKRQKNLFNGLKFFLNVETNRESLTFVIRAAGGEVSWDYSLGHGHRYKESHPDITHHIVDRPEIEQKHMTRYYVQPQWVYDCFNHAIMLPVQRYFIGAALPPHLSPFEETYGDYIPPDLLHIQRLQEQPELLTEFDKEEDSENDIKVKKYRPQIEPSVQPTPVAGKGILAGMIVKRGKAVSRDLVAEEKGESRRDKKLAEEMIHKRQKLLYKRLVKKERLHKRYIKMLSSGRKLYDAFIDGNLDNALQTEMKHRGKTSSKKRGSKRVGHNKNKKTKSAIERIRKKARENKENKTKSAIERLRKQAKENKQKCTKPALHQVSTQARVKKNKQTKSAT